MRHDFSMSCPVFPSLPPSSGKRGGSPGPAASFVSGFAGNKRIAADPVDVASPKQARGEVGPCSALANLFHPPQTTGAKNTSTPPLAEMDSIPPAGKLVMLPAVLCIAPGLAFDTAY